MILRDLIVDVKGNIFQIEKPGLVVRVDTSRNEYYHFIIDGPQDSFAISRQFWEIILEVITKDEVTRILIEDRLENKEDLSFQEQADLAKFLTENFIGIHFAYLEEKISDPEYLLFAEDYVRNRGLTGRYFNNAEAAKDYLING